MKINIPNRSFFETIQDIANYILETLKLEQAKCPTVSFSQLVLFFESMKDENIFCSLLNDQLVRPFIFIQEDLQKITSQKAKTVVISPDTVDTAIELISHCFHEPYPQGFGWDGTIVLRKPSTPATALFFSAYAKCRNLFVITTLVDKSRKNEVVVSPGNHWL